MMSPLEPPRYGELPEPLARWLQELDLRDLPDWRSAPPGQERRSIELLRLAAFCYVRAGSIDRAGQAFEVLGDYPRAASLHEQLGRWDLAARDYASAEEWQNAARCWLQAKQPERAAGCLKDGGQVIEAAWLLAHVASRGQQASLLLQEFKTENDLDRLGVEIVRARCDADDKKQHERGSRRLRELIPQLLGLADSRRQQLFDRAFQTAKALNRPDLGAVLHATALAAGLPGAAARWEQWAQATLGTRVHVDLVPAPEDHPESPSHDSNRP